jgi:hypothetical protein
LWWSDFVQKAFILLTNFILHKTMKFSGSILLIICFCIAIAGCKTEKKQVESTPLLAEQIMGTSGHFRGHSIGDVLDTVVLSEREFLFKRTRDELNYSIPFSPTDSAHFDIAYVFDQFGLFEIQVDIYPATNQETTQFYADFKKIFESRYGQSIEKTGSAFWDVKEAERQIEITLRDESIDYEKPFLSINILEPQSNHY